MKSQIKWVGFAGVLLSTFVNCGGETQELGDAPTAGASGNPPSGGSGSGNATPGSGVCETDCVRQVFGVKPTGCKICHDTGNNMTLKSAGLDLVSPNYTARLKDALATHSDITTMGFNPATDCPVGDKLIDSANPQNSWLLKKIRKQQGLCGDKMPSTMDLTIADQSCVETYVACVAAN